MRRWASVIAVAVVSLGGCASSSPSETGASAHTCGGEGALQTLTMPSTAMEPTIATRSDVTACFTDQLDLAAGDLIVFDRPDTEPLRDDYPLSIRRVVATEGSVVSLVDGELRADGRRIPASQRVEAPSGCLTDGTGCAVPQEHVFVVGDNAQGSRDSRLYGPIPKSAIVGIVMLD